MNHLIELAIAEAGKKEELLFRVYNLKTQSYYPDTEELFLSSTGESLMTASGEKLDLKENIIQRCTGKRDMKGRLIYEGDILKTDEAGWKAPVVWGYYGFTLEDDHGGFSAHPDWESCMIIGRLFNPQDKPESPFTAEQEEEVDFWHACWKGDWKYLKKVLPKCKKYINHNLERVDTEEQEWLCLPLIAAINSGDWRAIKLLLQYGAKLHKKCKEYENTPYNFAKSRKRESLWDMLKKYKALQKGGKKKGGMRDER